VLEIDHCGRCGGVWFDHGEVERLRSGPSAAFWATIARREAEAVTPCHNCHAPLSRELEKCPSCGRKNVIDCPVCDRLMQRQQVAGITLDVCRTCKGVWFDHAELDTIWKAQSLLPQPGNGRMRGTAADTAGDVALGMMWYAPDIPVHAAIGLGHAASAVPEVLGAAPEVAAHLAGAAGEAAGGIFEVIAGILEAIFGLFDG
jgi:Zn-finger nucleic acid-binding protein